MKRGIGREICLSLASEGVDIAYCDIKNREKRRINAGQDKVFGEKSFAAEVDVSKEDRVVKMVQDAIDELGCIDIFVSNAGIIGTSWLLQMVRNLTDCFDGLLHDAEYLIVDRDPLRIRCLQPASGKCSSDSATKPLRLPARSPNLNPFAECLSKIIPLGERRLRSVINEYVKHYHTGRYHQNKVSLGWFAQLVLSRRGLIPGQ